jgi:ferredoxin
VTERVTIQLDRRSCEGHGLCTELSPEVFDLGDEDVVTVLGEHPDETHWADVRAAVAACPRQAITLTYQKESEQ